MVSSESEEAVQRQSVLADAALGNKINLQISDSKCLDIVSVTDKSRFYGDSTQDHEHPH